MTMIPYKTQEKQENNQTNSVFSSTPRQGGQRSKSGTEQHRGAGAALVFLLKKSLSGWMLAKT